MNYRDLYGAARSMPGSGGAPAESSAAEASGPPVTTVKPALFWVAIIGILVGARLLWEYAE
jgi:hypothetical protein